MPKRRLSSSVSTADYDDDDFEGSDEEIKDHSATRSRAKRSTASTSDQKDRKTQNRVAQREFRMRKVQYVKELEARVALTESTRDEQLESYRVGMRSLMEENQKLRELLASVSGFIGEGMGSVLTRLNLGSAEFNEFLERSKSELAITSIQKDRDERHVVFESHHTTRGGGIAATSATSAMNAISPSTTSSLQDPAPSSHTDSPPSSVHPSPSIIPLKPLSTDSPGCDGGIHSSAACSEGLRSALAGEMDLCLAQMPQFSQVLKGMYSTPTSDPKQQALQLISYHMSNYRRDPSYHLPPSLLATPLQQAVNHPSAYDGIIFGSMRDRLITCQDQYDFSTVISDLVNGVDIHDDGDCLEATNWEFSEAFMRKYWFMIEADVLASANRWRLQRGESELTQNDLRPVR